MKFRVSIILFIICIDTYSQGLGIPSQKWGIGFGNLSQFSGLRFNLIDSVVEINGINIRLMPRLKGEESGTINGISVGLLADAYKEVNGISVGLLFSGGEKLTGINIGGLGSGGEKLTGINIGGLALGGNSLRGINVGGLGVIGSGGESSLTGINLGVGGVGASNVKGLNIGGIFCYGGAKTSGFNVGGLMAGGDGDVSGVTIGGLVVMGSSLTGLNIGGIVTSVLYKGVFIGGYCGPLWEDLWDDSNPMELRGVSISLCNNIRGYQKGVTVGIINGAHRLDGLQLGLINYVKENPKLLRILPLFNTRFGKRKEEELTQDENNELPKSKFNMALIAGVWIPTGDLSLIGTHPDIGFQLGRKYRKVSFDVSFVFKGNKSNNSYYAVRNDSLELTNIFFGLYFGVDLRREIYRKGKNELSLIGGFAFDGFDVLNEDKSKKLKGKTAGSPNLNFGLGYRYYYRNHAYIGINTKYNVVDYTLTKTIDFTGNPITIHLIFGVGITKKEPTH